MTSDSRKETDPTVAFVEGLYSDLHESSRGYCKQDSIPQVSSIISIRNSDLQAFQPLLYLTN